ncbi:MAG: Gfo/Idh/MocA family oxidoreductase [Acidimicrobiia bacterium]
MRAAVIGVGAVGARAARQLGANRSEMSIAIVDDRQSQADAVVAMLGPSAQRSTVEQVVADDRLDVVVLATASHDQVELAERLLKAGHHVVTTTDDVSDVRRLMHFNALALAQQRALVLGATVAPGLSCLITRFGSARFELLEEVHVAKTGTGGPSCARQHHEALSHDGYEWRDGEWRTRTGGSGRELCWFPEPVGALDCYHGAFSDPLLLHSAFPDVGRVTARMSATRRDRITARLPMLRRPHPEGAIGAVRVELRGVLNGEHTAVVFGAIDRPAVGAGAVAAVAATHVVDGNISGAIAMSQFESAGTVLHDLALRGVKIATFEGTESARW